MPCAHMQVIGHDVRQQMCSNVAVESSDEIDQILLERKDLDEADEQYYKSWRDRCNKETAVDTMLKVCARFKKVQGHIECMNLTELFPCSDSSYFL